MSCSSAGASSFGMESSLGIESLKSSSLGMLLSSSLASGSESVSDERSLSARKSHAPAALVACSSSAGSDRRLARRAPAPRRLLLLLPRPRPRRCVPSGLPRAGRRHASAVGPTTSRASAAAAAVVATNMMVCRRTGLD